MGKQICLKLDCVHYLFLEGNLELVICYCLSLWLAPIISEEKVQISLRKYYILLKAEEAKIVLFHLIGSLLDSRKSHTFA